MPKGAPSTDARREAARVNAARRRERKQRWAEGPKGNKRDHLLKRAKARFTSEVRQAREDPNRFVEFCFHDSETGARLRQADIHRELQAAMASGEDCVNEFPRDHGKTTQLEAHAIWRLGNNPNMRIKIVCASDSKAIERLFAITQHLEQNDRVQAVFPWLKPARRGDWTKHKIVVDRSYISRDASIEALGVLSTATGGRADLLLADDVVDRRNALELPKLRETVKTAWDADWSNLLEPNAQSIYNATPWHVADLTHKIRANPTYRHLRYAVGEQGDHFAPIWSEKWPREALERRRMKIGQLEYDRGFRLIALSGDITVINSDWIGYWVKPPDLASLRVFAAFDVSSGTSKDYFACVVVGVDPATATVYVLESWHAKLTFLARAEAIESVARRWMPQMIGLEQENMKSLSQYLDATTLLSVLPMRPHLAKSIRLMNITPLMERGQVVFNPTLEPGRLYNPDEHGDLIGELTEFPLSANDDMVDAYVYALNLAQAFGGDDDGPGVDVDVSVIGDTRERQSLIPDSEQGGNGVSFGRLDREWLRAA